MANPSDNASAKLRIIRAIHPDRDANFRAIASSQQDIKKAQKLVLVACTQCLKTDGRLRKCSKCKGVWYCSKECQIKDWPVHKKMCCESTGILKLIQKFAANIVLMSMLQICLILEFDLLRNPAADTPFMARVNVGIEPSDITSFFQLLAGTDINTDKIEGMFQINAVVPLPAGTASVSPKWMEIWRAARKESAAAGFGSDPIGLVEYIYDTEHSVMLLVHIQRPALKAAQKALPFVRTSALTGARIEKPLSPNGCIEFINSHIRSDAHNQLSLRTIMKKVDIEVIRSAGRGEDGEAVRILKEKMARESIYQPIVLHV